MFYDQWKENLLLLDNILPFVRLLRRKSLSFSRSLHLSSRTLILDFKNEFSSLSFIKDTCWVGAGGADASVDAKHKYYINDQSRAKIGRI